MKQTQLEVAILGRASKCDAWLSDLAVVWIILVEAANCLIPNQLLERIYRTRGVVENVQLFRFCRAISRGNKNAVNALVYRYEIDGLGTIADLVVIDTNTAKENGSSQGRYTVDPSHIRLSERRANH